MRTAREVIAEAIGQVDPDIPRYQDAGEFADAALANLQAEGLVIVAAADVRSVLNQAYVGWESDVVRDRLDAALAAGGADGH